jgi:hypothetical protein
MAKVITLADNGKGLRVYQCDNRGYVLINEKNDCMVECIAEGDAGEIALEKLRLDGDMRDNVDDVDGWIELVNSLLIDRERANYGNIRSIKKVLQLIRRAFTKHY